MRKDQMCRDEYSMDSCHRNRSHTLVQGLLSSSLSPLVHLFPATCCSSTSQVRLMLERNREDLQRQLAAADTQLSVMQARLGDANTEVEGLRQRLGLEQGR